MTGEIVVRGGIDDAWAEAEMALPPGWYISNVRSRSERGRWSASATKGHDKTGTNYSGFGDTPAEALRNLAKRLRNDERPGHRDH
jgi:hypothetical protein